MRAALAAALCLAACVHDRARVIADGGSDGGGSGGMASSSSASASHGGQGGAGGQTGPGCGDGLLDPTSEQCDDGNLEAGDNCDASCQVECAAGWYDPDTHHCYLLVATATTWADARSGCASLGPGYDLAAISSDPEHQFLLSQLPATTTMRIWIGAHDQNVEGAFEWSNGERWGFVAWAPDEPNDSGGNEDCGELRYLSTLEAYSWNDVPCDYALVTAFLCELIPAGALP